MSACKPPNTELPAKRPNKIEVRDVGAASKRSKKPSSISVASAAAPVTEPNNTPWVTVPANVNCRYESTLGNPGRLIARLNDDDPSAAKNSGKISDGAIIAGCRNIANIERRDNATNCRAVLAGLWRIVGPFEAITSCISKHVVEAGLVEFEMLNQDFGLVKRAHHFGNSFGTTFEPDT